MSLFLILDPGHEHDLRVFAGRGWIRIATVLFRLFTNDDGSGVKFGIDNNV